MRIGARYITLGSSVIPVALGVRPMNPDSLTLQLEALCQKGRLHAALDLVDNHGIKLEINRYAYLLQSCIKARALIEGRRIHDHIVRACFRPNIFLWNTLILMYSKCGSLSDAREVFNNMAARNIFSWNMMIGGYAKQAHGQEALELYSEMEDGKISPNTVTFTIVIGACTTLSTLEHGKRVHARVIVRGCESDTFVSGTLVDMYAKCGIIRDAREIFDRLQERNIFTWTIIIGGYAQHGLGWEALNLFKQMQKDGLKPNAVTFVSVVNACASLGELEQGMKMHHLIEKSGCELDIFVGSALVDMYAKCECVEKARDVFDRMPTRNVVSWSAIVAAYAQYGNAEEALNLFAQMQQEGIHADNLMFGLVINACANLSSFELGKWVHACYICIGVGSDVEMFVENTLIDMYAKCGSMGDAQAVFERMKERNVISWSAMIAGYDQQKDGLEALLIFQQMCLEGVLPNGITFISVLSACASIPDMEQGKKIHALIKANGCETDTFIHSALIDMYAKCGGINDARRLFDRISSCDVVVWNTIITAYCQHGDAKESIMLFKSMQQKGAKPNEVTFVAILSACNHGGLLDEGYHQVLTMASEHGIIPCELHYACVIDLLGRAGWADQAGNLIQGMPFDASIVVWKSFLRACRVDFNSELAEHVLDFVIDLHQEVTGAFVLLSNIYARAGN